MTVVGIGEDGADGLSAASRTALENAETVLGAPRHLGLLGPVSATTVPWPVPFADGLALLLARRGTPTVALASGDPFWFGAGRVLAEALAPTEWRAIPGPSAFAWAAARLGWGLEGTVCLGLHAAPVGRLRPHVAPGVRLLVLVRDGAAVTAVAAWLTEMGFGPSALTVLEALGGPAERVRTTRADTLDFADIVHPVCLGIEVAGPGPALPKAAGLDDDRFQHDGQITKRPIRAVTLSSLAPLPGWHMWDLGAGSGSIGLEWLLAHPTTRTTAVERDPARAARIEANAAALGVEDRMTVIAADHTEVLDDLRPPDAVFIGGGLSEAVLQRAWGAVPPGGRLVANAVTLESESLLTAWHTRQGGALTRIELSTAEPLGGLRGWRASHPVVQWVGER